MPNNPDLGGPNNMGGDFPKDGFPSNMGGPWNGLTASRNYENEEGWRS